MEPNVLVAIPNYMNLFSAETYTSHSSAMAHWTEIGLKFNSVVVGRTFVHFARTQLCELAVKGGYTHVFWLDDDAVIEPDLLPTLLNHDKDLIVTPYPMRKPPHEIGVLISSVGDYKNHPSYVNLSTKDLDQGLIEVDGGGTHAMLMKTEVLQRSGISDMDDKQWYTLEEENEIGRPYVMMPKTGTEDMYLCYRLKLKGVEIWCDTDVFAGHVGFAPVITRRHTELMEDLSTESAETTNSIPVLHLLKNGDDVRSDDGGMSEMRSPTVDSSKKANLV